ncbi:MAG TPA: NADH-quinone oxidoreductase subunit L [Nevskiaceae bacterium]
MLDLLFLVFLFPLAGFFILAMSGGRFSERTASIIGVGAPLLAVIVTILVGYSFFTTIPTGGAYTQFLWNWIDVPGFHPDFALRLDGLSMTMISVVTGVSFLIILFSVWYMHGEEGFSRFFAYMNLFVTSMLFLVLANNLLFTYFGWEGVGLCSYLLIGFLYKDPANCAAARKAFLVTRIGDVAFAIAMWLIVRELGTLNIQEIMRLAPEHWAVGSGIATAVALLLLLGACGKSAQFPLQTWLPDAMAGPTPVSALLHAATMVTAGVYLIARTNGLFLLAPLGQEAVGVVGTITLVVAGFCALSQTDVKRVLAYSTMSQIGYMFLALGVGAWSGAIFHLMSHAFFKALLFLSSGSLILACHHEQNMFRMGGLWKKLPVTFAGFVIGGLGLAAIPPGDGYFSKDLIMADAFKSGHYVMWGFAVFGAFLTAVYTARMIFLTFFGEYRGSEPHHGHGGPATTPRGWTHHVPLVALMIATLLGGWFGMHISMLPASPAGEQPEILEKLPLILAVIGVIICWPLFVTHREFTARFTRRGLGNQIRLVWFHAMGFDWLWDHVLVKPWYLIAGFGRRDFIDQIDRAIERVFLGWNKVFTWSETGHLRWYAASVGVGAVLILAAIIYS